MGWSILSKGQSGRFCLLMADRDAVGSFVVELVDGQLLGQFGRLSQATANVELDEFLLLQVVSHRKF